MPNDGREAQAPKRTARKWPYLLRPPDEGRVLATRIGADVLASGMRQTAPEPPMAGMDGGASTVTPGWQGASLARYVRPSGWPRSRKTAKSRLVCIQSHANLQDAAGPRLKEDFESIAANANGSVSSAHVGEAMLAVRPGLHDQATRPHRVEVHQMDANAGRSDGVDEGCDLLRQAGPLPSGIVIEQSGVQDIACPSWWVRSEGEFHERIGDGWIESLRIIRGALVVN